MSPKLAALVESVAVMRELGVTEWDGIKLGPVPVVAQAPRAKPSADELAKAQADEAKRILFAASGVMPK